MLHALKTLPEKIAAAELAMAELEQGLSDAGLYARDPARFANCRPNWRGCAARKMPTKNAGWRWKCSAKPWNSPDNIWNGRLTPALSPSKSEGCERVVP